MRTDQLIRVLAQDRRPEPLRPGTGLVVAVGLGAAISLGLLLSILGAREDFVPALGHWRLEIKLAVLVALALTAGLGCRRVMLPEPVSKWAMVPLLAAPLLLAAGVMADLVTLPAGRVVPALLGGGPGVCLVVVPLLASVPLIAVLAAMRNGAPASPALAGVMAGVLAGAIGGLIYALRCPEDSPLFLAAWYGLAIAVTAALGGMAGSRLLRW